MPQDNVCREKIETAPESRWTLEVRSDPNSRSRDLQELADRLRDEPRSIPAKFFYDARGSRLFEQITTLPEYYQTRTEQVLLKRVADEVVQACGAVELLELGSGAATKTRILLDAMERARLLKRYVPIDVDPAVTERVAGELLVEYPELDIHAIITDLRDPLVSLPEGHHRLVIFLGGTIGNLDDDACDRFLRQLSDVMAPGDHFLLGVDRIKDPARLEAAYNDATGVTAEFNTNMLRVVNRFADGNFRPEEFEHRAVYNESRHRIEMWLRSTTSQRVRLDSLGLQFELRQDDAILTEISTKYDRSLIEAKLTRGGFELESWHTDEDDLFALVLARRV